MPLSTGTSSQPGYTLEIHRGNPAPYKPTALWNYWARRQAQNQIARAYQHLQENPSRGSEEKTAFAEARSLHHAANYPAALRPLRNDPIVWRCAEGDYTFCGEVRIKFCQQNEKPER